MHTISEVAVTATIWVLTAAGTFFGSRAALRKKKLRREETGRHDQKETMAKGSADMAPIVATKMH